MNNIINNNNLPMSHCAAVMAEGQIRIEDHLVDANNKPIQVIAQSFIVKPRCASLFFLHCSVTNILFQAIINFDATYTSPDDADGNFEPTNLVNVIVQQNSASAAIGGVSSGVDDDQQMLLDIEQNIANLEKSLQKGKRLSLHWIRLSLSKG